MVSLGKPSTRRLIEELKSVVGDEYVIHRDEDLLVFEYDGSVDKALPTAVVLPADTNEVVSVTKLAATYNIPITARGAGTGLSGGAIANHGGIVLALTRMTRIIQIDAENMTAIVEPGVVNIDLSTATAPYGLYYPPDPSSQKVCTLGGNVAENSGGPHCLAYGVTTNYVLGLEVVLANGSVQWFGETTREVGGYDLRGIMVGSEGTLGIVTKIAVRLVKIPEVVRTLLAVFNNVEDASLAVSDIIAAGIVPAALEMMDKLCIRAAEASVPAGYPQDAGAILLVEVDGLSEVTDEQVADIIHVCNKHSPIEIRTASDNIEREKLWAGRKGVIGALGRLAPNYYLVDGTVPRTRIMDTLKGVEKISKDYELPIGNLLHAGDGNLHPLILFDERKPGDTQKALEAGGKILELCIQAGGVLSGEHGIGMEKQEYMPLMFTDDDMTSMAKLKLAFETNDILNPGKIFPTGSSHVAIPQTGAISRTGPDAFI